MTSSGVILARQDMQIVFYSLFTPQSTLVHETAKTLKHDPVGRFAPVFWTPMDNFLKAEDGFFK